MSMNKSEKCPNTIGTINLSPQFNRPQQGLLYALHTTKRKSKQQAEAKQHSKTEQQKPDSSNRTSMWLITFMLCCARGVAKFPASLSSRGLSLSSPENNAPQNTMEQQLSQLVSAFNTVRNDLKHKIEATKTDNKKLGTCGFPRTHSIRQKFSRIYTCSTLDTLA